MRAEKSSRARRLSERASFISDNTLCGCLCQHTRTNERGRCLRAFVRTPRSEARTYIQHVQTVYVQSVRPYLALGVHMNHGRKVRPTMNKCKNRLYYVQLVHFTPKANIHVVRRTRAARNPTTYVLCNYRRAHYLPSRTEGIALSMLRWQRRADV